MYDDVTWNSILSRYLLIKSWPGHRTDQEFVFYVQGPGPYSCPYFYALDPCYDIMYWIHWTDFISAHKIILTSFSIFKYQYYPYLWNKFLRDYNNYKPYYFINRKSFIKNCIRMLKCEMKCQRYRYATIGQRTSVNIWYLPMYTPQWKKAPLSNVTRSPTSNVRRTSLLCSCVILSYDSCKNKEGSFGF